MNFQEECQITYMYLEETDKLEEFSQIFTSEGHMTGLVIHGGEKENN